MEKECMTFGQRLTYARKQKGLNQKQFAELIGVEPNTLSHWERGRRNPNASMVGKITTALEESKDWFNNDDIKKSAENKADRKLTKEQQKLVAENERLIGYVSYKRFHFQGNSELYQFCYGYAAIGLCQAAKMYNPHHGGTFAGLACRCIYMAICHALRTRYKDRAKQPLSLNQVVDEKEREFGELIPAPDEWEQIEYKILVESVYQIVEPVLATNQKEVFRLWLHGKAEVEIARALGISGGSAKQRIFRAKKQCRASFNCDEIFC